MDKEFCIDYISHDKNNEYCILKVKDGDNIIKKNIPSKATYDYQDLMLKLGYKEVYNYDCWAEFARKAKKRAEEKQEELETAQKYFDVFNERAEDAKKKLKEIKNESCTWWNEDAET